MEENLTLTTANKNKNGKAHEPTSTLAAEPAEPSDAPLVDPPTTRKPPAGPIFEAYELAFGKLAAARAALAVAEAECHAACGVIYTTFGAGPFVLKGRGLMYDGATIKRGRQSNSGAYWFEAPEAPAASELE